MQRTHNALGQSDLYDALLKSFAMREVNRFSQQLSREEREQEAHRHLRDLAIVALAMFVRHRQLVYDVELNHDLPVLSSSLEETFSRSLYSRPSPADRIV